MLLIKIDAGKAWVATVNGASVWEVDLNGLRLVEFEPCGEDMDILRQENTLLRSVLNTVRKVLGG